MIPALMPTYAPSDVVFEKGEGVYLYDVDGKRYLDFAAGIAVSSLGHCHPHLVAALHAQVDKLWHLSNMYRIPSQERLAQRLVDASFADSVFFTNSGAEAVECGLKMIRKYHDDAGNPEKYRVIACRNAFHGRTMATIAAGGQEKHLQGFAPAMDGFDHVAFGNLNELRAAITPQTAAILVEPVQGEGGLRAADPEYLKALRQVADEFGLLLMFDEVQCGMGRTGKLFAHEWADVRPDIAATAKGIGGGFPLGACLATEKAAVLGVGNHGSTYGGNPLATTVGGAVLDVILENGFLDHVVAMGDALKAGLDDLARRFPRIFVESRGQGLMLGLKCASGIENRDLKKALEDAGLLVAPAGENVLRFLPPLIIEQAHIDEALGILATVAAHQAP